MAEISSRKRLLEGLKITDDDPKEIINILVTNLSKIITKLESEDKETTELINTHAKFLKHLTRRQEELEKEFASIRIDLKSTGLFHDEKYVPPPVDEVAKRPVRSEQKTSKKLKQLEKDNPFD